ncbi:MAG: class II aldolase/adducin family protein [Archaeoglobaceae archaeon]
MEELIDKYSQKLVEQELADEKKILFGARETEITWNRWDQRCEELEKIFDSLNINSLLLAQPAEPYRSVIEYLMRNSDGTIHPSDCETRTFLHDLPVTPKFDSESISQILRGRKSVITGEGIVTFGTVTPEQAFVTFSSVCFACFVKFFSDHLNYSKQNKVPEDMKKAFNKVVPNLKYYPHSFPQLMKRPSCEEDVYRAVKEAGKLTVDYNLVDSYFGNVSFRMGDTIYISQTASSLDELEGHIDPCPLDNSSCAGITASSELSAHRQIVMDTDNRAILHGHPKFAVILSMDCDWTDCEYQNVCHIKCPHERFINDIPIVPGEVGTGRYGLCNTMPPAIKGRRGAIVYGHGLFTVGKEDFNEAFENLLNIEKMCKELYFQKLDLNP